jgi:hypothetical protein
MCVKNEKGKTRKIQPENMFMFSLKTKKTNIASIENIASNANNASNAKTTRYTAKLKKFN